MMAGSRLSYDDEDFQTLTYHVTELFRNGRVSNLLENIKILKIIISVFYEMQSDKTHRMLAEFFKVCVFT